jgi:Na+-driven multidrug efflux pump
MTSAVLVTIANIILDYVLIFGHWGLPQMGIAGAAIASSLATGIGTLYLAGTSLSRRYRERFHPYHHLSLPWFLPIFRLSLPVIGQRFIANGSFLPLSVRTSGGRDRRKQRGSAGRRPSSLLT